MNRYFGALLIIFISLNISCSSSIDEALSYNEDIVLCYKKVADIEERLIYYLLTSDTINFNVQFENFKKQLDASEEEMKSIGGFNGDDTFQKEGVAMMNAYRETTLKELPELLVLLANSDTLGADSVNHDALFEKRLNNYDKIIGRAFDKFFEAQQKFAARYSIKIE